MITASGSTSTPIAYRSASPARRTTVPDPHMGSKTVPPGSVKSSIFSSAISGAIRAGNACTDFRGSVAVAIGLLVCRSARIGRLEA
jgi:hypothetical protein